MSKQKPQFMTYEEFEAKGIPHVYVFASVKGTVIGTPETEPIQEKQSDDKIPLPDSFKEYQDKFNQAYKAELAKRKAAKKAYTDYVNMFGKNIVCCLRRENDKGLFNLYKLKPKE